MSTQMSQKDYLKRYLSGGKDERKKNKKKKKAAVQAQRMRIVDDDIDPVNIQELEEGDLDLYELAENAPQIAGIVDERPPELQALETFQNRDKWRIITNEDEDIKIEKIQKENKPNESGSDVSPQRRNEDSDISPPRSQGREEDSDFSPPRTKEGSRHNSTRGQQKRGSSPRGRNEHRKRSRHDSGGSDVSPPRTKNKHKASHTRSSEISPPRRSKRGSSSDGSPPRIKNKKSRRDSDVSPPRHSKHKTATRASDSPPRSRRKAERSSSSDKSPPRRGKHSSRHRQDSDSEDSPPRNKTSKKARSPDVSRGRKEDHRNKPSSKNRGSPLKENFHKSSRRDSSSDVSPPRGKKEGPRHKPRQDYDNSPPRAKHGENSHKKAKRDTSSDISPPRGRKSDSKHKLYDKNRQDGSPPRNKTRNDLRKRGSPDVSPPRRRKEESRHNLRRDSSSDVSPARLARSKEVSRHRASQRSPHSRHRGHSSGSDVSPPRPSTSSKQPRIAIKQEPVSDESPPRKKDKKASRWNPQSSPNAQETEKKTLDGKKAGLQDAKTLKQDLEKFRAKEQEYFDKMTDDVSGRGATVVVRDRKTGKRRDLEMEEKERVEKEREKQAKLEKFRELHTGLVQVQEKAAKIQDMIHESSKPLARYADDCDLEDMLKAQEREGDPMLEYLREKRRADNPEETKPRYRGPPPPPNRFNIPPGHKWDGVDRSTGFEKKLFEHKNAKKALEEEAYKWSVADM